MTEVRKGKSSGRKEITIECVIMSQSLAAHSSVNGGSRDNRGRARLANDECLCRGWNLKREKMEPRKKKRGHHDDHQRRIR